MGPIIIFDKSMLESLNIDEACFLDNFFISNIVQTFYIETLADLAKTTRTDRSAENLVKSIAKKTPIFSSKPNSHHLDLMQGDLLGYDVPMKTRQIPITGGTHIKTGDKMGVFVKPSKEEEAMDRWSKEDFYNLEKVIASKWRQELTNLDLESVYRDNQKYARGNYPTPKSFVDVKNLVDYLLNYEFKGIDGLYLIFDVINVPSHSRYRIVDRWEKEDAESIFNFCPYSAYVASIELFFNIVIASDLISRERKSNKMDMAYLYYLPFCHIFTSGDKLHSNIAPLFLDVDQSFVEARKLKEDLGKLDDYYSGFPVEARERGLIQMAPCPPKEGEYLVSNLWDKHLSSEWRKKDEGPIMNSAKTPKGLLEEIDQFKDGANEVELSKEELKKFKSDNAHSMVLKRIIPAQRGKWKLVPPEVIKNSKQRY